MNPREMYITTTTIDKKVKQTKKTQQ